MLGKIPTDVALNIFCILLIIIAGIRFAVGAGYFENSENESSNEAEPTEKDEFSVLIIPDDLSKDFKSGLEIDPHLKKKLQERGIIPITEKNPQ